MVVSSSTKTAQCLMGEQLRRNVTSDFIGCIFELVNQSATCNRAGFFAATSELPLPGLAASTPMERIGSWAYTPGRSESCAKVQMDFGGNWRD
jgi:hypothetical protein